MQGTEKLSTRNTHRHTAQITGKGPFPLDMLRYEGAHPTDEHDSHVIANTLNPMINDELGQWTVRVSKYGDAKANWQEGRWASYHCSMEPIDRFRDRQ